MARQSVTKHLAVLEEAGLITTIRRGREKFHYLNAAPINDIADAGSTDTTGAGARARRSQGALEEPTDGADRVRLRHLHQHHPRAAVAGAHRPAFTLRYWGIGMQSDWKRDRRSCCNGDRTGTSATSNRSCSSPIRIGGCRTGGTTTSASTPSCSAGRGRAFAELVKRTAVEGDVRARAGRRDGQAHRRPTTASSRTARCCEGVRDGWPTILSNLKTLLETSETLPLPSEESVDHDALAVLRDG